MIKARSMYSGFIDELVNNSSSNSSSSSHSQDLQATVMMNTNTNTNTDINSNMDKLMLDNSDNSKQVLTSPSQSPLPSLTSTNASISTLSSSLPSETDIHNQNDKRDNSINSTTESVNANENVNEDVNVNVDPVWVPNKEPRKYTQKEEEEGYKQVLAGLTQQEKNDMANVDPNLCMRHYRADKGDVPKAIKRLKYAIQWRKDFEVDHILNSIHGTHNVDNDGDNSENKSNNDSSNGNDDLDQKMKNLNTMLRKESETGKVYSRGYNKEGRAILYFYPVRENTYNGDNNMKHLVYQLERAIACTTKNGFEKIIIIMDFAGWTFKNAPPMDVTKKTIHIVQDCYVERLWNVYITNAPILFRSFWAMVKPWLDPVTKNKIVFCSSVKKSRMILGSDFDLNVLEQSAFGTNDDLRPYDAEEYFEKPFDTTFDE
jgi:hypothetical protein